jgi:TPR repeat protein
MTTQAEPRYRLANAFLLLMGIVCSASAGAVTDCDRLAGHKLDPDGVVAGVSRSAMDMAAAEKACRAAVAAYPAHARSNYQLGRVLYYDGRAEESLPYLRRSAEAGYPQAIFVLGYIQTIEDGVPEDVCAAAELWQQSAALDHPWTAVFLITGYLEGQFESCELELTTAQIDHLEGVALGNIPYADSEGRVEAMQALLKKHRKAGGA